MYSPIESEQSCFVGCSVSGIEIKSEPQDIEPEVKTEIEEYDHIDVKQEILPSEIVTSVYTTDEVEGTQESLDRLLEDCEKQSQDEQRNTEQNKANVSIVDDHKETTSRDFEDKCVHTFSAEQQEANTLNLYKNLVFEGTDYGLCTHIPPKCLNSNICCKPVSCENKLPTQLYVQTDLGRKSFSRKSTLNDHIHTLTRPKPFTCNFCGMSFSKKSHLTQHTRTHTNEKPFTCTFCSTSFSQKSTLNQHIRTHTNEKPYTCDICKMSFSTKSHLNRHTRTHTNEKPFTCIVCNKSFSQKAQVIRHTRIHTNEKPYTCDVCDKSFSDKSSLNKHRHVHKSDNPFTSYNFSSLFDNSHTRTVEKPYKCNFCNKSFRKKYNLIAHIRTHTNEKPFSCDVCGMSFSQKSTLNQHVRSHTKQKPLLCSICSKPFSRKSSLTKHTRRQHTDRLVGHLNNI